jgi:hypothetical protein
MDGHGRPHGALGGTKKRDGPAAGCTAKRVLNHQSLKGESEAKLLNIARKKKCSSSDVLQLDFLKASLLYFEWVRHEK